ncbi:MAG: hypothetical protein ACJ72I_17140 [Pseudonocardiaceae bacterium]
MARWLALGRVSCGAARDTTAARILLVSALLVTVVWAWAVLARTQDFVPWLRVAVVVIGLVAVDGLSAGRRFPASRMGRRLGIVVAGALLTALAEPAAYAVDTAASPHGGTNTSRQIEDWVAQHFTGRTVDSVTLYDLTAAAS